MAHTVTPEGLASQARRHYAEELVKGLTPLVQALIDEAVEPLAALAQLVVGQEQQLLAAVRVDREAALAHARPS